MTHYNSTQRFSSTDLGTSDTYNTGVVFPLASGNLTPNFAGIMEHRQNTNKLAHFEYRLATGDNKTQLNYHKGRCYGIVRAPITPAYVPTQTEALLGVASTQAKDNSYYTADNMPSTSKLLKDIARIWQNSDFTQFTDLVLPDNVTKPALSGTENLFDYSALFPTAKSTSKPGTHDVYTKVLDVVPYPLTELQYTALAGIPPTKANTASFYKALNIVAAAQPVKLIPANILKEVFDELLEGEAELDVAPVLYEGEALTYDEVLVATCKLVNCNAMSYTARKEIVKDLIADNEL